MFKRFAEFWNNEFWNMKQQEHQNLEDFVTHLQDG